MLMVPELLPLRPRFLALALVRVLVVSQPADKVSEHPVSTQTTSQATSSPAAVPVPLVSVAVVRFLKISPDDLRRVRWVLRLPTSARSCMLAIVSIPLRR